MKVYLTTDEIGLLAKAENGVEIVTTVESIIEGRMAKRHRSKPLAHGGNVRILQVRVTEKLFRRIERSRESRDVSMSAAARDLIEIGLAAPTTDTEGNDRGTN